MSLRICLISREYPPDTGFGGIATFTRHLASGLISLGHEVHVVTLTKEGSQARSYNEDGINVHRVTPYFLGNRLNVIDCVMPYSKYLISTSSGLWEKFFELHTKAPFDAVDTPELLAEGLLPGLTSVCPLVIRLYTPHSKFIAEALHNVSPNFDHQFVAMAERVAMRAADAITSPSKDLAQFVANDLRYPLERIKIIYNPIDPDRFSPEGNKAITDKNVLKVLFVGRLEERKGIRYLIEAWKDIIAAVPDARLYIIGDDTKTAKGQTSELAQLKKFIQRYNLGNSIKFLGRVPLTDLPSYYRSADICVVPSVYDNSPYSCLEAMSCGAPVIGTSSGGTAEYVVHRESGIIVEAKNSNSIAKAVIDLLQNSDERHRLGENARTRVLSHFQRQEIARQTVELYKQANAIWHAKQKLIEQGANKLYPHTSEQIMADVEEIALSFNEILHQFLFQWSFNYRLRTWFNKLRYRPRLYLGKLLLRFIEAIPFWSNQEKRRQIKLYSSLERTIKEKEEEARLANRKYRPVKC